ncbi:class I SAM-dependent methyltransferase [Roseateles toxinivorans]|uniref:Methyltransferase family protein n=1 Tax=Roseateles toxinivorans TaxID=270368 RepID=A0A4R6QMN0_9BURK|nr:class I SAM-dependent methyltransferase [Roseateles toxinivorans]TDP71396.1 methyltransferase family protein [Roseateles toxinivorans]
MKNNVREEYSSFHLSKASIHSYPTEWVIRTMLGSYPGLRLDKSRYPGGKVLDLGFGDGRNIQLLHNCGLAIHGVEVSEETCELVRGRLAGTGVAADLRVGSNARIPFEDACFDYILACASSYYIDNGGSFADNLAEMSRVLKSGGYLIANFPVFSPAPQIIDENFILKGCEPTADGHVIIRNDVYGLRNGYKFKAFKDATELEQTLSPLFCDFSVGQMFDNYYGIQVNQLAVVCRKAA